MSAKSIQSNSSNAGGPPQSSLRPQEDELTYMRNLTELDGNWNPIKFASLERGNSNCYSFEGQKGSKLLVSHLEATNKLLSACKQYYHFAESNQKHFVLECGRFLPQLSPEIPLTTPFTHSFIVMIWSHMKKQLDTLIHYIEEHLKKLIFEELSSIQAESDLSATLRNFQQMYERSSRDALELHNTCECCFNNIDDLFKNGQASTVVNSTGALRTWERFRTSLRKLKSAHPRNIQPSLNHWVLQIFSELLNLDVDYRLSTYTSAVRLRSKSYPGWGFNWSEIAYRLFGYMNPSIGMQDQLHKQHNPFQIITEIHVENQGCHASHESYRVYLNLSLHRRCRNKGEWVNIIAFPTGAQILLDFQTARSEGITVEVDKGSPQGEGRIQCEYKPKVASSKKDSHFLWNAAKIDSDSDRIDLFPCLHKDTGAEPNSIEVELPLTVHAHKLHNVEVVQQISNMLSISASIQCTCELRTSRCSQGTFFNERLHWTVATNLFASGEDDMFLVERTQVPSSC